MGVLSSRRCCPLTSLQKQHSCLDEDLPHTHSDQDTYTHPGVSPGSFREVHLFIQFQIPAGSHQKVNSEKGQGFFSFFLDKHVPMNKTDFTNTFHLVNLTYQLCEKGSEERRMRRGGSQDLIRRIWKFRNPRGMGSSVLSTCCRWRSASVLQCIPLVRNPGPVAGLPKIKIWLRISAASVIGPVFLSAPSSPADLALSHSL